MDKHKKELVQVFNIEPRFLTPENVANWSMRDFENRRNASYFRDEKGTLLVSFAKTEKGIQLHASTQEAAENATHLLDEIYDTRLNPVQAEPQP